ncbi:MAG: RNA pseudouridine synthase [Pseudomonadota bacterium]
MLKQTFKVRAKENSKLIQLVMDKSGLSQEDSKGLIEMGAVWNLDSKMAHRSRLRDSQATILAGNGVGIFLDQNLLKAFQRQGEGAASDLGVPSLLSKQPSFEVWFKPSGWVSEGSPYGDHLSIERFTSKKGREAHAVNRLDREVAGLMILSFDGKSFAALQKNWGLWQKVYQAEVLGELEPQIIDLPLDGKEAKTKVLSQHSLGLTSQVELELVTGRFHQIRRHLEGIGHPVMGDPKYGRGNKDPRGLMLRCIKLAFQGLVFEVPSAYRLF